MARADRMGTLRSRRPPQRCSQVSDPSNAVIAIRNSFQNSCWSAVPARSMRSMRHNTQAHKQQATDACTPTCIFQFLQSPPELAGRPLTLHGQPACHTVSCGNDGGRHAVQCYCNYETLAVC